MGTWNETDMLTNLPIHQGEQTACLLIQRQPDPDNNIKPDSFFKPITPAFIGEYNDYGGVENIENIQELERILKMETGFYSKTATGYHDVLDLSAMHIIELAAAQQLYIGRKDGNRIKHYPVYLTMMHKETYNFAVNTAMRMLGQNTLKAMSQESKFKNTLSVTMLHAVEQGPLSQQSLTSFAGLIQFMTRHRKTFMPVTGGGYQAEIETAQDMSFYEFVFNKARQSYQKNRKD